MLDPKEKTYIADNNFEEHILALLRTFPNKDYLDILSHVHDAVKPAAYLEIGVDQGKSFALCSEDCYAVGIDPQPSVDFALSWRHKLAESISDDFFNNSPVFISQEYFNGRRLDLAFIDGQHLFEFVIRDFFNIEKLCHQNSVVLIHDCYPLDEITSSRAQKTDFWTGDVWKAIPALKKLRPDLVITTLPIKPSGLCVIQKLNPNNSVIPDYKSIFDEFINFPYEDMHKNRVQTLNLSVTGRLDFIK